MVLVEFNTFLLLLHSYIPHIPSLLYYTFQSNVISCLTHFRGENGQNLHM